jgi:hypothetical protein
MIWFLALPSYWLTPLSMNSVRHRPERNVTARLTFLTQSLCMKPTLQGLTWFQYCEISKYELLRRCMFQLAIWSIFCVICHTSMGANLWHVLTTCDKCSSDHLICHCTATFVTELDIYTVRNLVKPFKSNLITYFNTVPHAVSLIDV